MRFARWLFLLATLAILTGLGATYYSRLKQQTVTAPEKPKPLAPGTTAISHAWDYKHTTSGNTTVALHADDFQEVNGKQQLSGVTLDIFRKEGNQYDHVKSAKAEFDPASGILYSDGDVDITMDVPVDEPPSGRLMVIHTSGVRVEIKTSKASTDRPAQFKFDRGDGQAVGADYDPNTHELRLHSQVALNWRGLDPGTIPMKVEADQAEYKERESKVYLYNWSRLMRGSMTLSAGPAVVALADGNLQHVETTQAHGNDARPDRQLEYTANHLFVDFNDSNMVEKLTAVEQARLVSTAETAITTVTSDRVTMAFDTSSGESQLQTALAEGHRVMESKPVAKPGVDPADTRILKSDVIRTTMRPGGQDLETVQTESPGDVEFIPNRPGQPHRWMKGDKIFIAYGDKNQIQSVRSTSVSTRTEKPKQAGAKEDPPAALTWSKNLLATFQPNSSQLSKLEQWPDFRYEEGPRRAKADHASMDQLSNVMDLAGAARVNDASGSADADHIVLDQKSGDFTAEGHVVSTRMPDRASSNPGGGGMLSEDEPLHARANKMRSSDNNLLIHYEGGAVLWQAANRLEADTVEIDRDNSILKAHGHVVSQLLDSGKDSKDPPAGSKTGVVAAKPDPSKKPATKTGPQVFTVVRAPELEYNDEQRVAKYRDGVTMERQQMKVKAREIVAYLRSDSNDSSLDHAMANGAVEVLQNANGRSRDGKSEHAEYYVDEDKVILEGGEPQFIDSVRGTTRGAKLTWFSKDDRLLVNGAPARSMLNRKK